MNKLIMAVAGTVLATAAQAAEPDSSKLTWNNLTGGDVSDVANWSGVPSGVTDISYNDTTMYYGLFFNRGAVTLNLTLSKDFWFNRYYLQSANTKYDFDLGGHRLKMRGNGTSQISFNQNQKNQKMVIRNGVFDFYNAVRRELSIAGEGNELHFVGTDDKPMTIDGYSFKPCLSNGGLLVFSNVVAHACQLQLASGSGKMVMTGPQTEVWHRTNEYGGIATTGGGSMDAIIEDGALLDVIDSHGSHKVDVVIGGAGTGRNSLVVRGEGTQLVSTNYAARPASSSGAASMAVGYHTNSNRLHVTDRARVTLSSKLIIGNAISDDTRGSASYNLIRIDSNAVVSAADIIIGQRANKNTTIVYPEATYVSNTCVIADSARVSLTQEGLKVGTEYDVSHSAIVVSNKAFVSTSMNYVGTAGISNRLEIVDQGILYCRGNATNLGVRVGGVASTGAVFVVDGGVLAATNSALLVFGAASGEKAVARIANGADALVQHLRTKNTGNRIELADAALVVRMEGKFPYYADSDVEFAFSGRRAQLDCRREYSSAYTATCGFYAGASLSFDLPVGGFAGAPIKSGNGVTIQNLTACKFKTRAFSNAGGEQQVLIDSGKGTISIDAVSLAVMQAAASSAGGKIKLSADNKQLILSVNKGLLLLVR